MNEPTHTTDLVRLATLIEQHQAEADEAWGGDIVCSCGYYLGAWVEYTPHLEGVIEREYVAPRDAAVRREAHKEGYRTAQGDIVSGAFISGTSYEAVRDSFTGRQIAKEAREAALREAMQVIAGEDTIEWARRARQSMVQKAYAIEGIEALIEQDIRDGA